MREQQQPLSHVNEQYLVDIDGVIVVYPQEALNRKEGSLLVREFGTNRVFRVDVSRIQHEVGVTKEAMEIPFVSAGRVVVIDGDEYRIGTTSEYAINFGIRRLRLLEDEPNTPSREQMKREVMDYCVHLFRQQGSGEGRRFRLGKILSALSK